MPARRVRSHSRGCGGGSLPERTRASRGLAAAMKGSDTPSPPAGAWRWLRRHRPPRRSPAPPAGPGLGHMQPREPQAREALTWLPPGPPRAHWVTCPSEATGGPCPEHPEPSGKGPREPGTRPARGQTPSAHPSLPRRREPVCPEMSVPSGAPGNGLAEVPPPPSTQECRTPEAASLCTQWCSVIAQQTCPREPSLCLTSTRAHPSRGPLASIEGLAEPWNKSPGHWHCLPCSPT